MTMRKLISFWEVVFWCCHPIISTFQLLVWMTDGLNRFLCLIGKYSTPLCSVCVYVCIYNKHSFLIYSVYLEGLPRSDSDIPVQRVFLLWYRTKECWAYALSSKKKEYYLFVQLQEGWFSYVNSRLILFVTESTKSFIPMFKRKSLLCNDRIAAHSSSVAAFHVLLHGEYYRFHPSHAANSSLWGKWFPKGLIHKKKLFLQPFLVLQTAECCIHHCYFT